RDGFVIKINQTGESLLFSTFIGGGGYDCCFGIAVDSGNNVYVTGYTASGSFPTTSGAFDTLYNGGLYDAFMLTLNLTGSSLLYSTFAGGSGNDSGCDIAIDPNGNISVAGWTDSGDFPTTPGAYDTTHNGWNDVFVLKLYLNNLPLGLDLKISDPTVLRTNPIYLYSNASDFEDFEQNLTPFFEYRDPTEQVWNSTYFSNLKYNNSRWEVSFTPPKNVDIGLYDFRVRFKDTDLWFGTWFYLIDSLSVLNNIPAIENLFLSNNIGKIDDEISIYINASDVENQEENLILEIEYRDPTNQFWNTTYINNPTYINGRWESSFKIPYDAVFGNYDFRVQCNDTDGNCSAWLYLNDSLQVYNIGPKVIDMKLSKSSIYRTDSVFLFVNGMDHETHESYLRFGVQFKPKMEEKWIDLVGKYSNNSWKAEFITDKDSILGIYDFRVKFEDNESASSGWIYLNDSLEVLNNLPRFDNLTSFQPSVFRTESVTIYANCTDIETLESLMICEIQFKSQLGIWIDLENESYKSYHWGVLFTPSINADLGDYDIKVNFTDLDYGYSGWIIFKNLIEVKNNLPKISDLCDEFQVGSSSIDIDLTKYELDIEDSGKDLIWSIDQTTVDTSLFSVSIINISEDLLRIEPRYNVIGIDDITLILTDKDGGIYKKTDITIHINYTIFTPNRVSISVSPELIEIEQGKSEYVFLIVTNKGNIADCYNISFESDIFSLPEIELSKNILSLGIGNEEKIRVIITIPEDKKIGEYKIKFIAQSDTAANNTILTINIKAKGTQEPIDDDSGPLFGVFKNIILIILIIVIMFTVISSIFIGGTEIGKYKFLSLIFIPLYNKLHHDDVLDNFIRGQIYGYILAKPGNHYNAIKKALGLNNGTFVHHVRILEKEKYVYSKRDGFYTRFYPADAKMPIVDEPPLNEIQKKIIEIIHEKPGITQHEIVSITGTSQQVVSYNLTNLTRENILKTDLNGREKKYFLNYEEFSDVKSRVSPAQLTPTIANAQDTVKNQV
ncbi:MAG: winged helix-turn-helix transcriptional regulator, partial [Thermoplasmata archaeon]|nr:winged helix-turn-helix transcriptional regulator [Thermoplasmata archaeon]